MSKVKIVHIKRRPYNREKVSKDAELVAQDKLSIGPSMTSGGGILKGITPAEEQVIMPLLLAVPSTHPEFMKMSNEYFNNISRKVPLGGIRLDISLADNTKPLGLDNLPNSPADYVLWKYALKYKGVANKFEELASNQEAKFYIYSEVDELTAKNDVAEKRIESITLYAKVVENEKLIDSVIRILTGMQKDSKSPYIRMTHPEEVNLLNKKTLLSTISISYPDDFIKASTDKDLEKKSEVFDMINKGVISTAGSKFYFGSEEVGSGSIDHVVAFIKNAANSKTYTAMKATLETINASKVVA